MKIISRIIVICFFLSIFIGNPVSSNLASQMQSTPKIPFGAGSIDLELVVEHSQLVSSSGTPPDGQTGKILFYNIDTFNFPDLSKFSNDLGDPGYSFDFNLQDSDFFFKVIREDTENLEIQPGFVLGNDLVLTLEQNIVPNDLLFGLLSYTIPKDLSLVFPTSINQYKNPTNDSAFFDNFIGGNIVPPGLGLFLDPTQWENHENFYDWKLADYEQSIQTVRKDYINWYNINPENLPPNVFVIDPVNEFSCCRYFYETNLIVENSQVELTIPSHYVQAWESSVFDQSKDSLWNQNYPPLNTQFNGSKTINFYGTPEGTEVTVVFEPRSSISATNGQILFYDDEILEVYGVFSSYDYDWDKDWDNQSAINYYSSGNHTNAIITLGTNPQDDEHLLVVYRPIKYPIMNFSTNYLPNKSFTIDINVGSTTTPEKTQLNVTWGAENNQYSGWVQSINLYTHMDFDNDGLFESWEEISLKLVLDQFKTMTTSLPLSIGDQGSFSYKKASLDISLKEEYQQFWGNTFPEPVTFFENQVNSLQSAELSSYTIEGIDGLYYTAPESNEIYYPEYYYSETGEGFVVNGFDSQIYSNVTTRTERVDWLYSSDKELTDLYANEFSLLNGLYIDEFVVENITVDSNNKIHLSLPAEYFYDDNFLIYNASEYNWSKDPDNQNITRYYSYDYDWESRTNIKLFPDDGFGVGDIVVVAYTPARETMAISGKVLIDTDPGEILGVYERKRYYSCCPEQFPNPNLFEGGSYSNNVITLGPAAPSGVYPVFILHKHQPLNGQHLYQSNPYGYGSVFNSFGIYGSLIGVGNPVVPARTPDWFIIENNVNAFNRLVNDKKEVIIQYLKMTFNDQYRQYLVEDLEFKGNIGASWNIESGIAELKVDADISGYLGLAKITNPSLKADTHISFSGSISVWNLWTESGINKEMGLNLHGELETIDLTPPETTTPRSTISTSPGFELIFIFLSIPIVSSVRKRRKV